MCNEVHIAQMECGCCFSISGNGLSSPHYLPGSLDSGFVPHDDSLPSHRTERFLNAAEALKVIESLILKATKDGEAEVIKRLAKLIAPSTEVY